MANTGSADDASGTKADVEASLAALPPPTELQRLDMGWTRNWSAAWADHEKKLAKTYHDENGVETRRREASAEWKSREDLVVEGGGRVMFFDLTGGPVIRLAKERAMVRYSTGFITNSLFSSSSEECETSYRLLASTSTRSSSCLLFIFLFCLRMSSRLSVSAFCGASLVFSKLLIKSTALPS